MGSLARTLLVLTFVTGVIDAVCFLGLGQTFAAMQTGNVIFLGLGLSGYAGAPLVAPLVSLVAFIAGGGAALLARRVGATSGPRAIRVAIVIEVMLLAGAAILAAALDPVPEEAAAYAVIAVLAFAMGLRNTIVRQEGEANLTTIVLNLTLVGTSVHPALSPARGGEIAERAAAIAAIVAGALVGALLLQTSAALALATAAAVTGATGLALTLAPARAH